MRSLPAAKPTAGYHSNMAGLRIPQEYQRSFAEIRGLDEEQVQEFVSALESESPTVNRADLHTRVASNVDTIARSDLDRLLDTLVSLYALREGMGLGIPDFAEAVCEAMDESGAEELRLDDEVERDLFKARLVQLLGINSLDTQRRRMTCNTSMSAPFMAPCGS